MSTVEKQQVLSAAYDVVLRKVEADLDTARLVRTLRDEHLHASATIAEMGKVVREAIAETLPLLPEPVPEPQSLKAVSDE